MLSSIIRRATILFCSLALSASPAFANTPWQPDRTVRLVVPYGAGGGVDILARTVAEQLSAIWGQPVIVDNAPGAGGMVGTRKVIDAKPDGYTLLVQIKAITLAKHLPSSNGFDPLPHLVPVSLIAELAGVLAARADLPGDTLAQALQNCKTAAKPCSYATTSFNGRLYGQMLRVDEGLDDLIVVNYNDNQLVHDLVAGSTDMALMGLIPALPHYESGALKVLAILGSKRSSSMPDVPSAVEAGFPSLDDVNWYGLFAPEGTPKDVVAGIAQATAKALQHEKLKRTFDGLSAQARSTTPDEYATLLEGDRERADTLVKRFPLGE